MQSRFDSETGTEWYLRRSPTTGAQFSECHPGWDNILFYWGLSAGFCGALFFEDLDLGISTFPV